MAKANKKLRKPFNPATDMAPATHDRRATELPKDAIVDTFEIDDPMPVNPGDKVWVVRSLRSDPLAQQHARKYIDDAQYEGGRAYQRDWEKAERGPKAIDPAKEYVSGGLAPEGITDAQAKAVGRLTKADRRMGEEGARIAQDVLVGGFSMAQVAGRRGLKGESWELYFGRRFRECLETLAKVYGLAM